jgi:hypothetical protein
VELIPACARSVFDIIRPPTLEDAAKKFAYLSTQHERLEVLIRDSCHCYAAGERWLHAARRERELVPAMGEAVRLQEETLEMLVRAAINGLALPSCEIAVLCTMCDFPFWKSLVDAGISQSKVSDVIIDLALRYLTTHAQSHS